jgi:hypothetical protein
MKAGRPSYHIPAKWVTVVIMQEKRFYELDKKGTLMSKPVEPQRIVDCDPIPTAPQNAAPTLIAPPVPIVPAAPTASLGVEDGNFWNSLEFTDCDFDWDKDGFDLS